MSLMKCLINGKVMLKKANITVKLVICVLKSRSADHALYKEAMLPITFRISAEDADALKASADKQGVKVGDVVREACKLLLAQKAR